MIANITSWVQQGRLEISTLVERFKDEQRVFMLGDWNVGPGNVRAGIVPVHAGKMYMYLPFHTLYSLLRLFSFI